MTSFKDFLKSKNKGFNPLIGHQGNRKCSDLTTTPNLNTSITAALLNSKIPASAISSSDKEKISKNLTDIIEDDAFMENLSNNIGKPKKHETKSEFVDRSSNILREMLRKKLK